MNQHADVLPALPDTTERICACFDLNYGTLTQLLTDNPKMDFELLLEKTKAGSKCTACLLDLEYLFVETTARLARGDQVGTANVLGSSDNAQAGDPVSLKQRLYAVIDRYAPSVHPPEFQNYYLPVIGGHGIDQFVWIANRSLLFEGAVCAPAMDIELTVRTAGGHVTYDAVHHLAQESDLRVNVSQHLPAAPDGSPQIGSVRIARKAESPGFRGTTRPQIEIIASGGAACVHGQAPAPTTGSWQTFLCRPGEERLFFAVVNASSKPMQVVFTYPHPMVSDGSPPPVGKVDTLSPYGAVLHEVSLSEADKVRFAGQPFAVRWESPALHKAYILCAEPDLSSFSVDHV
jgi:hypothetical protein